MSRKTLPCKCLLAPCRSWPVLSPAGKRPHRRAERTEHRVKISFSSFSSLATILHAHSWGRRRVAFVRYCAYSRIKTLYRYSARNDRKIAIDITVAAAQAAPHALPLIYSTRANYVGPRLLSSPRPGLASIYLPSALGIVVALVAESTHRDSTHQTSQTWASAMTRHV